MQIQINEPEIITAILDYIGSQGFTFDADKADEELKAGRGEHGMTATIDMTKEGKVEVSMASNDKESPDGNVTDMPEPADSKKLKFGNDK